jgi:hypothetical protein
MSLRSLRHEIRRLAAALRVTRCACGAILPRQLLRPRPVAISEQIQLPTELEALEQQATPDEARELQTILNRCLELHHDAEARDWRFCFADPPDAGPQCTSCGADLDHEPGIRFVSVSGPAPPDDLLDILQSEPALAARFVELQSVLSQRAACSKEART